jgi:zinc protease
VLIGNLSMTRMDPDYYSAQVAESILCSSPVFSDRISKAVRVEGGLAYSVYGSLAAGAHLYPGTFRLYVGTRAKEKERALKIILDELKKFIHEGPSPEELQNAKNYLVKSFYHSWGTCEGLAGYLVALRRWKLGPDYHRDYRAKVNAVTREDVMRVAKQHIDLDRLVIAVVGPVDANGRVTERDEDKR